MRNYKVSILDNDLSFEIKALDTNELFAKINILLGAEKIDETSANERIVVLENLPHTAMEVITTFGRRFYVTQTLNQHNRNFSVLKLVDCIEFEKGSFEYQYLLTAINVSELHCKMGNIDSENTFLTCKNILFEALKSLSLIVKNLKTMQ